MNPTDQATFEQNWLKSFQSAAQQPQAQLQETQAAAGAAGASAALQSTETQTAEVKAQQAQALQGLGKDLTSGMTLKDAMAKYKSLGMSANDIFKQYLAQSPYGVPNENPEQLQELGVDAGTLGKIGDPGSFMDKYNTKNAITELRNLEDFYNKTNPIAKQLPIIGSQLPSAKAYDAAKVVLGNHLSSLIPGASGAQATGQSLLAALPDMGNPLEPSAASGQFSAIEKQLLASKGYSAKDIGLAERQQPNDQKTQKGSDLISNLLQNAGKDVSSTAQGGLDTIKTIAGNEYNPLASLADTDPTGTIRKFLSSKGLLPQQSMSDLAVNQAVGIGKQYVDIATNPQKAFTDHPVSSTLAILGPLLGLKGGPPEIGAEGGTAVDAAETASVSKATSDVFSKAPGKLQQFLNPGGAKNVIGQIRDQVVANGDKAGNVVTGDNIVSSFKSWADQAKLASPADSATIDDAVAQAEKNYAGKTFKPSELKAIYDKIESGYTVKGIPKSATSANIDRGMQDVLQGQLEKAAPGFAKTTDLFRQTFQSEKSPLKKVAIGAGKTAIGAGLGLAGLDTVRHILGL